MNDYISKVLFMDLDGTIICTKSDSTFPIDTNDWKIIPGVLGKIYDYCVENKIEELCIVTNQAGINEGYLTYESFKIKLNDIIFNMQLYLKEIQRFFNVSSRVGIHKGSKYRKPNCDWVKEEYPKLIKEKCAMVGNASGLDRQTLLPTTNKVLIKSLEEALQKKDVLNVDSLLNRYIKKNGHWYECKKDFSDSDKRFAENLGIKYIDIEEFLK